MSKITLNSTINVDRICSYSPNFFKFVASDEERQSLSADFSFLMSYHCLQKSLFVNPPKTAGTLQDN